MKFKRHIDNIIIQKPDYSKKVMFSLHDFSQEPGHMLQTVTVPKQTKQRLHKHFKQTEVYYILQGNASLLINNQEYVTTPGDAFIASPGDSHQIWNKSDKEFTLIVFKINMPECTDDTEWLE